MKSRISQRVPMNTVDEALKLAHTLSRDLTRRDAKILRSYQIFLALTEDEQEALVAFLVWKARGETLKEWSRV